MRAPGEVPGREAAEEVRWKNWRRRLDLQNCLKPTGRGRRGQGPMRHESCCAWVTGQVLWAFLQPQGQRETSPSSPGASSRVSTHHSAQTPAEVTGEHNGSQQKHGKF